ncbi:uncharacterized protein TNIN_491071 [Trichonephila inaurata madagascariensis]|uniref:Uncharacterized protein n=1 Tax=Trichonephila inaurata madagascariensis TaxID=2747483 RepID=A0A8X6XKR6_9ARAC|nr:uncharacterized protein TNIN_491071 [Trichonephila inaurata madagascariensis]
MLATKKALGAIVLFVLITLSSGLPYQRAKRSIIKDYFNPLTYPTDPIQFKKGDDGKYHLSKSIDSNVDYATAHGIDDSNEIMDKTMKHSSPEKNSKAGHTAEVKNEEGLDIAFGEEPKKELEKEEIEGVLITENDTEKKILESEEKDKLDILSKTEVIDKINSDVISEETEKKTAADKELKSAAKSDIPIDSKWSLVPKPDGKDDKPFRSDDIPEEYLPEPPTVPEKKEGDGKLGIGQIPHLYPVLIPPRMPMFIPKHFLLRISSPVPVPPAVHVSDRLPLPDADVVEESAETAVIENVAPGGPMVIKEGRKFVSNHFIHPLRIALSLPFMPVGKVLTEAVDGNKLKGQVKSEIVNINGKKLLLQRKVLKSSLDDDPSHLHVSVMSIQPLEDVNPEILKELEKEQESEDKFHEKEMKHAKEEDLEEEAGKEVFLEYPEKMDDSSIAKESPLDPELEIEKSAAEAKKEVAVEVIPPAPDAEKTINHEEEEKKIKEIEAEDEDEAVENSEEDSSMEESGAKKDATIDEMEVKTEDIDIILAEEEKNKEIAKDNIDKEIKEDEIVGAKNLFHLINQRKSKDVGVDGIITEVEPDESAFKIESQIKDKEVAESKTVEIEVKPIELDAEDKATNEEEKMIWEDKDVLDAHRIVDDEEKTTEEEKLISEDKDVIEVHSAVDMEEKVTEEELIKEDKEAQGTIDNEEKITQEKEKIDSEEKHVLDANDAIDAEKKDTKEIDDKNLENSEEKFKNKDFDLTKAEGAIFLGRKKEHNLEKSKEKKKPKKKCKCEEEDDSDSDSDEE